jgi:hypothetical protein
MTLKAKFLVVGAALVAAWVILPGAVERFLLVYPTPETESTFFRSFTPGDVVQRFVCGPSGGLDGKSAGAGVGYATHQKDFDRYFAIHASDWVPMMRTLQEEISSLLSAEGAQIQSQSGDLSAGFSVHYKSGTSVGVIGVEPLKTVDAVKRLYGPSGICKGAIAVELKVSVQEKWYEKEPGAPPEFMAQRN